MNLCQCLFNLALINVGSTNIMNSDKIILITIPVIFFCCLKKGATIVCGRDSTLCIG